MKKTALVTGAARGIGLAIARALAGKAFNIAFCDVHEEEKVKDSIGAIANEGAETLYCRADVSSPEDRARMLDAVKQRFGSLNVLVNNAGVAPKVRADILESSEESFERVMKINLQGPYFLTQSCARWMINQRRSDPSFSGSIINISSVSSTVASVSRGEYCLSKAGISMMTRLWAARLGEFDIPVYEIRPGLVLTDMTAGVKEKYDKLIEEGLLVIPRWAKPEDIGKAAAMLAGGDISYATGQAISMDGGLTLQRL